MRGPVQAVEIDDLSRAYLVAGLRIGQDIDGFVDSYYGPASLRAEAREFERADDAVDRLAGLIDEAGSDARREYFATQLQALRAAVALSAGPAMDYLDEVEATFDVRPEWTPDAVFETAHEQLDRLLPGSGPIAERRRAYREQFELQTDQVLPLVEGLARELRRRTLEIVDLPAGERADIQLVSDEPWSGYNWYLGDLRSRIDINTDLPVRANQLPDLIAHEMYCGHHTEHAYKEQHWLRASGHGEAAIALLTSPQAVISEGIATVAFDELVPAEEQASWIARHCFEPAGIAADPVTDLAIQAAAAELRRVDGNAALMLHGRGESEDAAVAYLVRYGLKTEREARQTLRFVTTPILRCYIFTYTAGRDLVSRYLDTADHRDQALRALYTDHWTPGLLRSQINNSSGTT